ncbi:cleavage and polyadenylation specificity factor subunit 1 [Thecamonas trahens ATCC 50062]|uniref:Cleavage and polyadenylation specificity factor subunit 1 n=1 Tax=Thecamonas trahens ATCC 50062 TaxID=461836 RepID=A0A0L0DQQ5_THETB|nr:cleavage and polyadenylation specificity factor subunit 1 [Thecamonas trahens ATCC 50062]KNC54612.1 cleavage and polyadenylation specificity factor subunit 1 [Thecamonas trahens ATCC 50062]|eukprot:XP_013761519.1 cleavage and polyadenylation specificity factor subunit 1 [Thecamonas trahens ATCC 50062]
MADSVYKELQGPTGVDVATRGFFLPHTTSVNLATARGTKVCVYSLDTDGFDAVSHAKLELVAELSLHGRVVALEAVRFPGSSYDSLLISLPEAKVTVVQWDASRHEFVTTSMHLFESDELRSSRVQFFPNPKAVVDPDNRCAAMPIYNTKLAIMPFKELGEGAPAGGAGAAGRAAAGPSEAKASTGSGVSKAPIRSSFVVDLLEVDPNMRYIMDVVFLHGYYEPTVLVLFASDLNFEGRMSDSFDNCRLAAISLNMQTRTFPVIWHAEGLSHSAFKLVAVPQPIGGAVVLTNNAILHYHQNLGAGLAVNGYAFDNDGSYPFLLGDTGFAFNLQPSAAAVLDPQNIIVVNPSGDIFMLHMRPRPAEGIKLTLTKVGGCIRASTIVALSPHLFFHGSHVGDALLIAFRVRDLAAEAEAKALAAAAAAAAEAANVAATIAEAEPAAEAESAQNEDNGVQDMVTEDPPAAEAMVEVTANDDEGKTLASTGAAAAAADDDNDNDDGGAAAPPSKRQKSAAGDVAGAAAAAADLLPPLSPGAAFAPRPPVTLPQLEVDDEDVAIFGESAEDFVADTTLAQLRRQAAQELSQAGPLLGRKAHDEYEFRICDRITNIGPITSATLSRACETTFGAVYEAGIGELTELVVCCGQERSGALAVLSTGIRPDTMSTLSLLGSAAWAVEVRDPAAEKNPRFLTQTVMVPAPVPTTVEGGDNDVAPTSEPSEPSSVLGKRGRDAYEEGSAKEPTTAGDEEAQPAPMATGAAEDDGTVVAGGMVEHTERIPVDFSWHKYFVVSSADATIVLSSAGFSISEVTTELDYYLEGPTVLVAPLLEARRTIQVYPTGLRLLNDVSNTQELSVAELSALAKKGVGGMSARLGGGTVVAAFVADPYVVLRLSSDDIVVLRASAESMLLDVLELPPDLAVSSIAAASLFADKAGVTAVSDAFVDAARAARSQRQAAAGGEDAAPEAGAVAGDYDSDEELYAPTGFTLDSLNRGAAGTGPSAASSQPAAEPGATPAAEASSSAGSGTGPGAGGDDASAPSGATAGAQEADLQFESSEVYLVVARRNGTLELRHLPELTLAFAFPYFSHAPALVTDTPQVALPNIASFDAEATQVTELALVTCGPRAYLVAFLSSNDIVFYEAFHYDDGDISSAFEGEGEGESEGGLAAVRKPHVAIRLRKVQHRFVQEEESRVAAGAGGISYGRIIPFDNVAGQSGIFVAGLNPMLCTFERSYLRIHAMHVDGPVRSFTPYHSASVERGFSYVAESGAIKFSTLPKAADLEHDMVVTKVAMQHPGTPRAVASHPTSNTVAVALSHEEIKRTHPSPQRNKEHDPPNPPEELPPPPNAAMPTLDVFELVLFAPGVWEVIDVWADLKPYEHISVLKHVQLRHRDSGHRTFDETTAGEWGDYLVAGTSVLKGEENKVYGRLLVFEVVPVVPEPGKPWTNRRFKLRADKACKGGVTQVTVARGILLAGIEQTLLGYVYNAAKELLEETTFHDAPMLTTQLTALKDYVMMGDVMKSIFVFFFRSSDATVHLLARDYDSLNVVTAEFMVDGKDMHYVVADDARNLRLYSLMDTVIDSRKGRKLLRRTTFHLGSMATTLIRTVFPQPMTSSGETHVNIVCSADGSIGMLLPVDEMMYKRLAMLHSHLVTSIPHAGGLHPVAFRQPLANFDGKQNYGRPVLDANLLTAYLLADANQQADIVRKSGTSHATVWSNLRDIFAPMISLLV